MLGMLHFVTGHMWLVCGVRFLCYIGKLEAKLQYMPFVMFLFICYTMATAFTGPVSRHDRNFRCSWGSDYRQLCCGAEL